MPENNLPIFTVVVPVFNRDWELERCLASLERQTFQDFECLVVDDGSPNHRARYIVEGLGPRFKYLRLDSNGGPSVARLAAFGIADGKYIALLDSDNEYFPWALERAFDLFEKNEEIGGLAANYIYPDGLRTRVLNGTKIVTPVEYRSGLYSPVDQVGMVRRQVIQEWLAKKGNYFHTEFHLWLTYGLTHMHLMTDEPWGYYHEGAGPRNSLSKDIRKFSDITKFISEHRPLLGNTPCVPLDRYLLEKYLFLTRSRRYEAKVVGDWLRERGFTKFSALSTQIFYRFKEKSRKSKKVWTL
jgi:glycosyltransferase involved in cell wall biosynthesis